MQVRLAHRWPNFRAISKEALWNKFTFIHIMNRISMNVYQARTGCRHICLLGGLWPANLAFYPQVLKFTGGFIWNCPRIRFHPLDPSNQLVSTVWTSILSWIVFQITPEVSFVSGICEYVKYLKSLCWCYWWIRNGKYLKASSLEKVGRLTLTLSNMLGSSSSICLFNAPCSI